MKEETILLCTECLTGELNTLWSGDEGWNVCPECNSVEGGYFELSLDEYESLDGLDIMAKVDELREREAFQTIKITRL